VALNLESVNFSRVGWDYLAREASGEIPNNSFSNRLIAFVMVLIVLRTLLGFYLERKKWGQLSRSERIETGFMLFFVLVIGFIELLVLILA
jgi:hypothetical protein